MRACWRYIGIQHGLDRCWSDNHLGVGVLSTILLPTLALGGPLLTFVFIVAHKWDRSSMDVVDTAWRGFVDGDYKPAVFYVRHIGWAVQFVVLSLNQFVEVSIGRSVGIAVLLLSFVACIAKLAPFADRCRSEPE